MTKILYLTLIVALVINFGCKSDTTTDEPHGSTNQSTKLTKADKEKYSAKGKAIVQASFAALSGALQKAIDEGNISNGVRICNGDAGPIIDSLSAVHHATIKRTSLKIRNLANRANKKEEKWLKHFEKRHKKGKKLKPTVELLDAETVAFYAPILTKKLCLKCHGEFDLTMDKNDYSIIQSLYMRDEAIEYKEGDFRGIWSITLDR